MLIPNLGFINLGTAVITTAQTNKIITSAPDYQDVTREYVDRLEAMCEATFFVNFNAGNGAGTSVKVDIHASGTQGQTWAHVARFAFLNANAEKVASLIAAAQAPVASGSRGDDEILQGIRAGWWRASYTSVGTFGGNASVSVLMNALGRQ